MPERINHLFIMGNTPENVFSNPFSTMVDICWAGIYINGPSSPSASVQQIDDNVWFFCGPTMISGNTYKHDTERYFELYATYFGRLYYENYENFYGIILTELGVEHTFVDVGLDYPLYVFLYNHKTFWIGNYWHRIWYDVLYTNKRFTSYDDFINEITKRENWRGWNNHVPMRRERHKMKMQEPGHHIVETLHSEEIATIIVEKTIEAIDINSNDPYFKVWEEINSYLKT